MEIEKLIDELRIAGAGNPGNIFDEAANALEQLKQERDAAIKDLEEIMFYGGRNIDTCDYCKNAKCYGRGGRDLCDPEWRGIQKEER